MFTKDSQSIHILYKASRYSTIVPREKQTTFAILHFFPLSLLFLQALLLNQTQIVFIKSVQLILMIIILILAISIEELV